MRHDHEAAALLDRVYEYLLRTEPWFDYWMRHEPHVQLIHGGHCDALRIISRARKAVVDTTVVF